jgi:hypothetical protein
MIKMILIVEKLYQKCTKNHLFLEIAYLDLSNRHLKYKKILFCLIINHIKSNYKEVYKN